MKPLRFIIRRFSNRYNTTDYWNKDKIAITFDSKQRLIKSAEESKIIDSSDPFLLFRFNTANEIFELLEKAEYSYEYNDNLYFLKRLEELSKKEGRIVDDPRFKKLVSVIKQFFSQIISNSIGRFVICCFFSEYIGNFL